MPRRLPVLPLVLAATVGLFALTSALTAQPPTAPPSADDLKKGQDENFRLYKRFADELLKLAQKWEKSDSTEEKERAKTLRAALKVADEQGVENMFKGIIAPLTGKTPTGGDLPGLIQKDAALVKALREVLETLSTEDEAKRLRDEILSLEALKKEAERIKAAQENHRAQVEGMKADANKLADKQGDLAKQTQELANKLGKDPKDPKKGDGTAGKPPEKDDKAEQKAEAKPGDPTAEPKSDTQDPKGASKEGDPKAGEPKGDPKGGMPPDAGSSKETPKDGAGEPKPMGGDPKNPMPGDPKDPMGANAKPMDPSDSKSQGDGKGMGKPADGGGETKPMSPGGMPSDSPPSPPSGSKGSPSGSGSPPPPGKRPPNPNNPNDDAQRGVEEAVPPQEQAEKDLKKNERDKASEKESEAIKALEKAIKELEKRLKQLREKEMLKKLEDLERRVAKMLQMQTEVKAATERIDQGIKKGGGTATTADRQKSDVEAGKEGLIAEEAGKALRLLEGEGTAVVFAGVLVEAQKDMLAVQKQLNLANVGEDTQLVEQQIIDQLKQMLEALKKAKQELENQPPPPPSNGPPPGEQKKNLIQLIEQLKLLKSLQVQVNDRTGAFGKRAPGPQATDPFLQEQLKQLGDRQKVLQDMLHKIAAQMNEP